MRVRPILYFGVVALIAAFIIYRENRGGGAAGEVVPGRPAPNFQVTDRDGKVVRLSDFRGHLVFLNFWATWCPPCIEEMPEMNLMNKKFQDRKFKMVAISVDTNWGAVNQFYTQYNLDLPTYLDPGRQAANMYRTFKFPETYLIGPDGVVIKKYIGGEKWGSAKVLSSIEAMIPGP